MHEFIQEMHEKTLNGRDVLTVGETWGATPEIGLEFSAEHRKELSMIFQFEHLSVDQQPGKTRWDLKELDFEDLTRVLTKWQLAFQDEGWNSLFWDNHDSPRIVSRWGNDTEYRIESAKMFAVVMLLDTLSLILIPLVMILFNDIKNVPAAARLNLQNGELMFAFFGIKTAIMVKRYSGSNVADKTN